MSHRNPPVQLSPCAQQGRFVSLLLTVGMHVLLVVLLVYGINWQTEPKEAVSVELVRAAPPPSPAPEPAQAQPPKPAPEPPAPEPPPKATARPDIALKDDKRPKEPPKLKEPSKPQPKPEPKHQPKPKPQPPKPDDTYNKQLAEEYKRADERRKAAEQARAIDQELASLKAAQANSARSQATADYIGRIRARIRSNIILPPDLRGNPEAVFDVVQIPGGEIIEARLRKSSGHAGYDAAVERAIRKSSPLPRPERSDVFERELRLTFHPLDD